MLIQRVAGLQPRNLLGRRIRIIIFQDLRQLDRLVVALDVLELQRSFDGVEQVVKWAAHFGELGRWRDEAFVAGEFAGKEHVSGNGKEGGEIKTYRSG
jgi:hypothetical protein